MKNIIFFILMFVSWNNHLFAQNSVILGTVNQADSTFTIPGVSVYLDGETIGASTNGNGRFLIDHIPKGEYTIVVSNIGYHTVKELVTVNGNDTIRLDFTLIESISSLPEVTITGGSTGIKDIPGSVTYISPKEIQKLSYTDINRVLRTVPGVNIQEEDGFGLFPSIGLRGTGVERNTKITVMEDGILIAPAPYAAPAAYYFPTMGRLEGVEIIKGSSQIKYGPYTTGGAVNLISTQIPDNLSGKISLIGGSFKTRSLHAVVGNKHKNVAYMVETFQYGSDGFKEIDGSGNTGFDRNSGFIKQDYLAKIRVNTNPDAKIYQSLTFKAGSALGDINETYLGLTQEDFDANPIRRYSGSQVDNIKTNQSQFSLTHKVKFSKAFSMTTVAYRTNFKRNWYKLDLVKDSLDNKIKIADLLENPTNNQEGFNIVTGTSSVNDDALWVKANNRSYYSKGIQTNLNIDFKTNQIKHHIEVGIRVHQDQIDRFQWYDKYAMDNSVMKLSEAGIHGTESNRVETSNAVATYIQYKLVYKKLTIIPGLRYENITQKRVDYGKNDPERTGTNIKERENNTSVFIPGIGLDYRFNKYLGVFSGIHKGFAPPGSKEEIEPEESVSYELGTRYAKSGLSGQAVLFFNDYKNLLGTDLEASGGGGTNELFNGGAAQVMGVEFNLTYDVLYSNNNSAFRLPITFVYSYTDSKFSNNFDSDFGGWGAVSAGDQFPYLAKNQFTIIAGLNHHKFGLNLSGKYIQAMRTTPGQGEIPENEKIDASFILDASVNYYAHKSITLFGSVNNITNQLNVVARRPAGLRPSMPRSFNIGVKARF